MMSELDLPSTSSSRVVRGENNTPYDENDVDFLGSFLSCPTPQGMAHVSEFHFSSPSPTEALELVNTCWSRVQFGLRFLDFYCALSGGCSARTEKGHEKWWLVGDVASFLLERLKSRGVAAIFVHCNQNWKDNSILRAYKQTLKQQGPFWYFESPIRQTRLPCQVFPIPIDFTKYKTVQVDQTLFELDLFAMYCIAMRRSDYERVAIRFHGDDLDALYSTTKNRTLGAPIALRYMDLSSLRPWVRRRDHPTEWWSTVRPRDPPSLMQLSVFVPLISKIYPRVHKFYSEELNLGGYDPFHMARTYYTRSNNPWSRYVNLDEWDLDDNDEDTPPSDLHHLI
jgi:hypothetical protein